MKQRLMYFYGAGVVYRSLEPNYLDFKRGKAAVKKNPHPELYSVGCSAHTDSPNVLVT